MGGKVMHAAESRHSRPAVTSLEHWSVGTSLGHAGSLGSPPSAAAASVDALPGSR